jgi:Short C-terminal domain
MGLLGNLFGGRLKDPVRGTAQVVSCSGYRGRGVFQNCHMELVVQADGVPATAVEFQGLVHNKRWPVPGMTLPVTVDRANPQRVKVEWDEVSTSRDRSRAAAEGLAATMRGEGGGAGTAPGNVNVVNLSGRDLSNLSEEQRQKLRMLGIDAEALAAQAGGAPPTAEPDSDDEMDERLERLEKLATLRDEGVLTDAEFESQKQQILGG